MPLIVVYGLYVIATGAVAYGSTMLARSHAGGFVGWLLHVITFPVRLFRNADAITWINDLTRFLTRHVGSTFEEMAPAVTSWLTGVNQYLGQIQSALFSLPVTMVNTLYWLLYVHIPHVLRASTGAIARTAHAARVETQQQAKQIAANAAAVPVKARAAARSAAGTLEQPYVQQWDWIKAHWKGITSAVGLAGLAGAAGEMPYGLTIRNLRIHLRRLDKLSIGGLAAGALAMGLARLGLSHLKCNNNTRFGRALCRTPLNFFNDLLGILADVWVLDNICGLLPQLERAASVTGLPLVRGLTALAAALPDCQKDKPGVMSGPPVTIPAVYTAAATVPAV